jgi:WD repeat-containing protein 61
VLASTSLDQQIRIWDLVQQAHIRTIEAGPVESWKLAFSPCGRYCLLTRYIASGTHQGTINIWISDTGEKDRVLQTSSSKFLLSVAFSPNGLHIAAGSESGTLFVFDVGSGKLLHSLPGHGMAIRTVTFSADSKLVISGGDDKRISIHDVHSGNLISQIVGHQSWVLGLDVHPTQQQFLSCGSDARVKVWDLQNSKNALHTFQAHSDQIWDVKYDAEGQRAVSVGDDAKIVVYGL